MKIAIITDVFYPHIGGVEKRFYELAKRLSKKHKVHVFTMQISNYKKFEIINNIYIHRFHRINNLYVKGRRKILPSIFFSIKLLFKLLFKKFDIIECNSTPYFPCFVAKFISIIKGCPLSITFHEAWGSYWYEYLGNFGVFGRIIELFTGKLSKNIISVSEFTKRKLVSDIKINSENIEVIPNGIDSSLINNIQVEKDFDKITYVGRLNPEKNIDLLIKAFYFVNKRFTNKKLYILGNGPELKKLKELCSDLKLDNKITFIKSFKLSEDVIKFIKSCGIFVIPSRREGQSIVCLESMAALTPVITIDCDGNALRDIIKDGCTGLISKPSPELIGNCIIRFLSDPDLYKKIQKESYLYSINFDWNIISENLINYYYKIIYIKSRN
ncbi:MAG: glycosyltransferase family 4 protein [Candidatus Helarchaeota archaeon]